MASNDLQPVIAKIKRKVPFDVLFKDTYPDHYEGRSSKCPFHDDSRNSFEIHDDHGYCHAGCTPGNGSSSFDVISLWMLAKEVDFRTAVRELAQKYQIKGTNGDGKAVKKSKNPRGKIVATYDYTDRNGSLLFQTLRYQPKDFKQRRPDGNGRWIHNLKGVPRVPYRLADVLKAESVWICEGEKDADSLAALGLCGTTAPMGAGKWPKLCKEDGIHEWFSGKEVFICPDHDKPGRQHAEDIAQSLHEIAYVKIIRLPSLSEKSDVSDFINLHGAGKAKSELLKIAESTPEVRTPCRDRESQKQRRAARIKFPPPQRHGKRRAVSDTCARQNQVLCATWWLVSL